MSANAQSQRPRLLIVSPDAVGSEMAGPGIRAVELGRALADVTEVSLGAPDGGPGKTAAGLPVGPFDAHDPRSIHAALDAADLAIVPPLWPRVARALRKSATPAVFDLYVPEPLETIEHMRSRSNRLRRLMYALSLDRLDEALHTGHRFICASEKQRDLWLGALLSRRLIDLSRYDRDPSLRSLIDVVPFGTPAEPPQATAPGPRERFGIAPHDPVVLWNGGIWSWLDAPTAIAAIAQVAERRPGIRLIFMGASDLPPAREARKVAEGAAEQHGVTDRVIFNDGWVPYDERAAWLLDADCAVSTQLDHLETRFAFRTRLLDCFWAGLPVVCTAGDDLGDRVARDDLGATAPPGDVASVAAGIERVLDRGRAGYRDALANAAAEFDWRRMAAPIATWIEEGVAGPRLSSRAHGGDLGQRIRGGGYRGLRRTLDAVGLRGWPRL